MSRIRTWCAGALVLSLVATGRAGAADVRFDPAVDLSVYRDGNVRNASQQANSASVARLGVSLGLSWSGRASTWAFSYRPYREFYDGGSARDQTGHGASVRFAHTRSERTSVNAALAYTRTDRQELDPVSPDPREEFDPSSPDLSRADLPRSTFQTLSLRVGGAFAVGRRSSITWGVTGGTSSKEDVFDPSTGALIRDYDDSGSASTSLGWSFRNSPSSTLGGSVGMQRFGYDQRSAVTLQTANFHQSLGVGRDGVFDYGLGVLHGTSDTYDSTDPSFTATYRWSAGPQSSLSVGVRQSASAGSGQGATLDRGGFVGWTYARPLGIGVGVTAAYGERKSLGDQPTSSGSPPALTLSEKLSFATGRFVRLGVFHSYRHQGASAGGDPVLESSYHSYGFTMNWLVRGERRAS